jgi:RimJ/RimL family protein N-acetyltransferase
VIELRPPSSQFVEVAKVWHTDQELNALTGFPKGLAGVYAAQSLISSMLYPPADIRFYALWQDNVPVGYTVITDIDLPNRLGDMHITIPKEHQLRGIGRESVIVTVNRAFSEDLFRITIRPFSTNYKAINTARKAGFRVEAYTKFSVWTEDGPKNQVQMRAVKPEWLRFHGSK